MTSELRTLVKQSTRSIPNAQWVADELDAVQHLKLETKFLSVIQTGRKIHNTSNSSIAYLIGITDEAPDGPPTGLVKSEILDFPDVDIDFEDRRRDEVKAYVSERCQSFQCAAWRGHQGNQADRVLGRI